jgi:hypothetical protein
VSALWLPLAATAAASGATYLFCVRPMLRGRGCMPARDGGTLCAQDGAADTQDRSQEIRALREEVQLLTHEVELRADAGHAVAVDLPATGPGGQRG